MPKQVLLACCNPFQLPKHNVRKSLRKVQSWMVELKPDTIHPKALICVDCRKQLGKLKDAPKETHRSIPVEAEDTSSTLITESKEEKTDDSLSSEDESTYAREFALTGLNESLRSIGESPVKHWRLPESSYCKNKFLKVNDAIRTKVFNIHEQQNDPDDCSHEKCEILQQLQEKFVSTTKKSEKITILTVLPKSWSIRKVYLEFPSATQHMIRTAKNLVEQKGILSSPNRKVGKPLSAKTVKLVHDFYISDEVSRVMPGKKDFLSIYVNGIKTHAQKQLLLGNLNEIYIHFKELYPEIKVGFSKFAELRPKNCVLAGASGTHAVCICTIHHNVKLMLAAIQQSNFAKEENNYLKSYHHCLPVMICNPAQPACYFGKCSECPGSEQLAENFFDFLNDNGVENVTFKQWLSTDRSTLETLVKSSEDFTAFLIEKLQLLLQHSFIATEQAKFLKELKVILKRNEVIALGDFAENYSFILQDASQGFHWNNSQATIHPFVAYFLDDKNNLAHENLAIISDCMTHNTVAVHLFQKYLINHLREICKITIKKMYYFSDGCSGQYKNCKNFLNLTLHEDDFNIPAEWHFFATSHGKSACDGIGGTVKRLAAKASLQRVYSDQIMTPYQLFDWAKSNISNINFVYVAQEEYTAEEKLLEDRFSAAVTVPGTQQFHSFVPVKKGVVQMKKFSNSDEYSMGTCAIPADILSLEEIKGFVTCMYNSTWWLGCVLDVNTLSDEIQISFLHPHGPSRSFVYPSTSDILWVSKHSILTKVDPSTETGRTYKITEAESNLANQALLKKTSNS